MVKLSTSGLERSERTCKISNSSYNCYVKRAEDRFPLFPVTKIGKYHFTPKDPYSGGISSTCIPSSVCHICQVPLKV